MPEKGLVKRVVSDIVAPFVGTNLVVYCDNYFTSGTLVDMLAKDKIYLIGSRVAGFPDSLKTVTPPKGIYVSESVDGKNKIVSFVTVFPGLWTVVFRLQPEGIQREQSPPPHPPTLTRL